MTLKDKLTQLTKEIASLKEKLTTKLQVKDQAITDLQSKLSSLNKENTENEQVLETLLQEFKELTETL